MPEVSWVEVTVRLDTTICISSSLANTNCREVEEVDVKEAEEGEYLEQVEPVHLGLQQSLGHRPGEGGAGEETQGTRVEE